MKPRVEDQQVSQALNAFGCRPSAATQTFNIVAEHGAGVIETEQRIKAAPLKLPLADDAASSPLVASVSH